MKLGRYGEDDNTLLDAARDEPRPSINIKINGEQIDFSGGACFTDKHSTLSSVIEVACPVVEHGYFDQFSHVLFEFRYGLRFACSEDEGNGFDFHNLPDPTAPDKLEQLGGRGIFLMKHLSDEVSFSN